MPENQWFEQESNRPLGAMHRALFELRLGGQKSSRHPPSPPVSGHDQAGRVDHCTRVRCYQAAVPHFAKDAAKLSLLPLAMCTGGPLRPLPSLAQKEGAPVSYNDPYILPLIGKSRKCDPQMT